MRAIVLSAYGSASALQLTTVPDPPPPGPDEVLVRVAAAGINPIDWKLRSGAYHKYMPLELPAILGRDVSGTVAGVGPGVTSLREGVRVLGLVNRGYAELVVAPVASFAEAPQGLELIDAAALPLALLTGSQLAENAAEVGSGETVLVTGATGSVGRVAVFCAQARGAKVYAGVRGAHAAEAAKLGAAGVIVLDDDRQIQALPTLDVLLDTVGGETTQKLLGKLATRGRIASVVGEPAGAKERGLAVRAFLAGPNSRRLAELTAEAAAGRLVIPIARRLPLAQAAEGHALAEKGAGGKVLLTL